MPCLSVYTLPVTLALVFLCLLPYCLSLPLQEHSALKSEPTDKYSVCSLRLVNGGILVCQMNSPPGQQPKISKCRPMAASGNSTQALPCDTFLSLAQMCSVSIELEQVATIAPFNKARCPKPITYTITLDSLTVNESNIETVIMEDGEQIHNAYVQNVHFDSDVGYTLYYKFALAQSINLLNVDTNLGLITETLNYTVFPNLREISINSTKVGWLDKSAIVLGDQLSKVHLTNLKVNGNISTGAIALENLSCSNSYEINIKDLVIQTEQIQPDFINFQLDNLGQCANPIHVSLSMEGDSFERILHENMFKNLLQKSFSSNQILFSFSAYDIDCCLPLNKWLFDMMPLINSKRNQGRFKSKCVDLGSNYAEYRNQTELEDVCYNRNVSPILIMAIVASLVLATLLAVFTIICISYVIPKRNQEIMISKQSSLPPFSKMKVPATKVSNPSSASHTSGSNPSAISNKTADTQLLSRHGPLLSSSSLSAGGSKRGSHERGGGGKGKRLRTLSGSKIKSLKSVKQSPRHKTVAS